MRLLFNDLIYTLIYKERVTVPTKCTAPLSITFYSASKATKVFTGTFLFAVISISKGYSRANPQETPYPSA